MRIFCTQHGSWARRPLLTNLFRPTQVASGRTPWKRSGHTTRAEASGHSNRLAQEQSPYLLQHAQNPVDWYPWGEEAFAKAREEQKPIYLSVGYATCHWCHVMERESFEDEETAAMMNKNYVCIKVDREERPDVDRVYMTYVQAISGQGGWPMSVWLTPDLQPFYGGTYYPKKDIFQGEQLAMPGFQTVLRRIATMWGTNQQELKEKGAEVMRQLADFMVAPPSTTSSEQDMSSVSKVAMTSCFDNLGNRFDRERGGFGGAPKFPRPSEINVLLSAHNMFTSSGDSHEAERALDMATFSLHKMAAGGMYDHVGGGFHRYSVDEFWHVPHFEKMLYDNPQLAVTYLRAFQLTKDERHARVARGILDYLLRDMKHPEGGIYSAEDADSLDPSNGTKKEGHFYVWTKQEIVDALGQEQANVFCATYRVQDEGNCNLSSMSDPHKEFVGKNVLMATEALDQLVQDKSGAGEKLEQQLASNRKTLHELRLQRPRPGLDNKVVTAWNGMSISAFALASRALAAEAEPCPSLFPVDGRRPAEYLAAAIGVASFVKSNLYDANRRRLRRSFCQAPSAIDGFADDYALMVAGLLDLYECGGGYEWLDWAIELQLTMDELFMDAKGGGYYSTLGDDPSILLRIKDEYDGAEPTATSIAVSNLIRLAALAPSSGDFASSAQSSLSSFQERLLQLPLSMPQLCAAAYLHMKQPLRQVIIAGAFESEDTQRLLDAVHSLYTPDMVVTPINPKDAKAMATLHTLNPVAHDMVAAHFAKQDKDAATAFVCQNYTCKAPTMEPVQVVELLKNQGPQKPVLKPMTDFPGMT